MAQYTVFDSRVEVSGSVVLLVIDSMGLFARLAKTILAKHGITKVEKAQWYPQQVYLDILSEIHEQVGLKTLKQMGRNIPEKALWPPYIGSVEEALPSIDAAYQMNHRGGEIGSYAFTKTSDSSGTLVCRNPYPCPFDEGIVEGTAKKFAQNPSRVRVAHIPKQPCRMNGDDRCTYTVSW